MGSTRFGVSFSRAHSSRGVAAQPARDRAPARVGTRAAAARRPAAGRRASGGTTSSGSGGASTGGTIGSGGSTPATGGTTGTGGAGAAGPAAPRAAAARAAAASAGASPPETAARTGTGGSAGASGGVTVQLDQKRQTIEGFGLNTALGGGSFNWDNLFGTTGADGIGLSIVRVGMNSDGSLSGDVSGAKSHNVKIIGSVWTAPAAWKDNNNESKGGHLIASHYDEFATRIATFAKNQGLYAMSAANEPDFASCGSTIGPPCNGDYVTMVYTANEMVNFVKVLGPKLKANGVKLMAPEPSEWIHLWSNASATGSTISTHVEQLGPAGLWMLQQQPDDDRLRQQVQHGRRIRLWPLAGQGRDGLGRRRHHRDARVRHPKGGAVAGRRRRWQAKQRGLGDRGLRRHVLAGARAVQRHQQRHRRRRMDPLRAGRRRGFGLALLVVQADRQRQRRHRPVERSDHQAVLHDRQLQQVRATWLRDGRRHGELERERVAVGVLGDGRDRRRGSQQEPRRRSACRSRSPGARRRRLRARRT